MKNYLAKLLTIEIIHDIVFLVDRFRHYIRRHTQVWLKGSVLKTDRRVTPRVGSNPTASAILIFNFNRIRYVYDFFIY